MSSDYIFLFTLQLKLNFKLFKQLTVPCGIKMLRMLESHPHSPSSSTFPPFPDPIQKQWKFPSVVTRELSRSLNFSPNSSFKATPISLPWEQGPHCSAVLQQPKEGAHFFGAFWAQPTHPHRRKDLCPRRLSINGGKRHFWISVSEAHLLRGDSCSHQI